MPRKTTLRPSITRVCILYTLWNGLMTPEVKDPLLDHFVYTLLDNVIVYGHWARPVVVELGREM
jgi:hypothetical protein